MQWLIYMHLQVFWEKWTSSYDDLMNLCVLLYFFLPWILDNNSWEQSSSVESDSKPTEINKNLALTAVSFGSGC